MLPGCAKEINPALDGPASTDLLQRLPETAEERTIKKKNTKYK